MNANPTVNAFPAVLAHLFGILLVMGAAGFVLGVKVPLMASHRAAILLLLVAGFVICSIGGIGRVAAAHDWAHPISILGYLLGAAILVVGGAYLLGRPLPLISGDRAYVLTISGMILAKIVLTQVHGLLR